MILKKTITKFIIFNMSNLLLRKPVNKVKKFLNNIGQNIDFIVLENTARTAENAANSLNKKVGAIVKSLLFKNEIKKEFYLCLVSGDKYLSLKKLSKIIGNKIIKASANECKEVTGFSIGAVSPFAHSIPPQRIFIYINLKKHNTVYAAAGHPSVVFEISYKKLLTITKSEENDIVI